VAKFRLWGRTIKRKKYIHTEIKRRFDVFSAVTTENIKFWEMTPSSMVEFYRRFGGIYYPHLQGRGICEVINKQQSGK
jgi:hypothetical protein